MLDISSSKHLSIILPNTNKALFEALKSASPKELELITQNKDLKSILNSLLLESSQNSASNKTLLTLVKNNPTLKDLGNIQTTIKELLSSIKSEKTPIPLEKVLKNFLIDIKQLDSNSLKSKFSNSGVFLESKLLDAKSNQQIKEILGNDLKSILLLSKEEIALSNHPKHLDILRHIDKIALGIDYYQLMSHLSDNSSLYLPFSWDALEEGQIELNKTKDDRFYCDIELKLKEYGELKLRLVLYEKNQLNIQISSDNSDFRSIIKENIPKLRSSLIGIDITPREIRIQEDKKQQYEDSGKTLHLGFEVTV